MKLKNKDIERLVEKYYNGSSSEDEELLLKANAQLNEDFNQAGVKAQFESMKALKNKAFLDDSFDDRLFKEIKASSRENISLPKITKSMFGVVASIAAIVIIWFGVEFFKPSEPINTINDPAIAFQETRWALEDVSDKLNKGLNPAKKTVRKIDNSFEKTKKVEKLNSALEKTRSIQKLDKASNFLQSISKVYVELGNS
jgi:hypothetical protein